MNSFSRDAAPTPSVDPTGQARAIAQVLPRLLPTGRAVLAAALEAEEIRKNIAAYEAAHGPVFFPLPHGSFPLPMCGFAGGLCGAVSRDGTVVVVPEFDWVDYFHEGRALVRSGGLYGYVDENGRLISRPQYDIAGEFSQGLAQIDVGGKSGLIDREGHTVLEPRYGFVVPFTESAFWVTETRRITGGPPGSERFQGIPMGATTGATVIFGGFGPSAQVDSAGKWGLVDRSGRWIRAPEFSGIGGFDAAGLVWAKAEAGWGLIRPDGTWQVEPRFHAVGSLSQDRALVGIDRRWGFVDATGRIVIEPRFDFAFQFPFESSRQLTTAHVNKLVGLIDGSGNWVVEPKYDVISNNGFLAPKDWWGVEIGKKHGLLDETGRLVVSPQFDQTPRVCDDGRIAGYVDKKPRLLTPDGRPIEPPEGELWQTNCYAPQIVKVGDKFGYADAELRLITPPGFERAGTFSNGLAVAKIDGKAGLLRPDGTWAVEPRFEAIQQTRASGVAMAKADGKSGLIDVSGSAWIVPPKFDGTCSIPSGLIMAVTDGKRGVMDTTGAWLIEPNFTRVGVRLEDGLVPAQVGDKWAMIDTAGTVVLGAKYDEPTFFERGINWVKSDMSWCPIDRGGRQIPSLPCQASDPMKRQSPTPVFQCQIR
jgi:hypothetical protein